LQKHSLFKFHEAIFLYPFPLYKMESGRWYVSQLARSVFTGAGPITAYYLYAFLFFVTEAITLDRINIYISTAVAGGLVRLGIYNDDGSGKPGSLLLDAGEIDASTTGNKSITISQALNPGVYWLAFVGNNSGIYTYREQGRQDFGGTLGHTFQSVWYRNLGSYPAALPDPFGTPGRWSWVYCISVRIS